MYRDIYLYILYIFSYVLVHITMEISITYLNVCSNLDFILMLLNCATI